MFIAALFRTIRNLEWTCMFFSWWMDEQILPPDSGILLSNTKNKWLIRTCHNVDESWTRAVWKKPESKAVCLMVLFICYSAKGELQQEKTKRWRSGPSTWERTKDRGWWDCPLSWLRWWPRNSTHFPVTLRTVPKRIKFTICKIKTPKDFTAKSKSHVKMIKDRFIRKTFWSPNLHLPNNCLPNLSKDNLTES